MIKRTTQALIDDKKNNAGPKIDDKKNNAGPKIDDKKNNAGPKIDDKKNKVDNGKLKDGKQIKE